MAIPGISLPGLNLGSGHTATIDTAPLPVQTRIQALKPNTEYRFECSFTLPLKIRLISGTAEVFGTELAPNVTFTFTGTKAAIFTWHGCSLQIEGNPESEYVAEETEMVVWANLHFGLENMRGGGQGPRVCLVGPENVGKTSLLRTLTGYAINAERQPIVVNLDPRQGLLSVPGSLTATAFATQLDVEEGWGSSPFSGPSAVPVKMPLVYHYGMENPEDHSKLFKPLVTRLALAVTSRMEEDKELKESGCFIDTSGAISAGKGGRYDIIQHIVSEFSVNVLLVVGSERLYSDLSQRYSSQTGDEAVTVVKLSRSNGCVDKDEKYMQRLRQQQVRQYFFGREPSPLTPYTQNLDFNQLTIFKVIDKSSTTDFLPGDADDDEDYDPSTLTTSSSKPIYEHVTPSPAMNNSLLAVTHVEASASQEDIRDASVLGYVYVADIDEMKKKVRCLSPVSGQMPRKAIVWGTWPEGVGELAG